MGQPFRSSVQKSEVTYFYFCFAQFIQKGA